MIITVLTLMKCIYTVKKQQKNFLNLLSVKLLIGSIANNRFSFNENVKSNSLTFISQAKSGRVLPEIEKIILKFLKDYCLKNNLLLGVSTRVRPDDLLGKEKYTNILGDKNWIYFPRRKPNVYGDYEAYGKVMLSEYIVSIDSTLGL